MGLVVHGFLDILDVTIPDAEQFTNFWPGEGLGRFGGEEIGANGANEEEADYEGKFDEGVGGCFHDVLLDNGG